LSCIIFLVHRYSPPKPEAAKSWIAILQTMAPRRLPWKMVGGEVSVVETFSMH